MATYLTEAPGSGNFSAPINLFNLRFSFVIAAFLGLSAFFHLLISSPKFFPRYEVGLKQNCNTFRWVEYSIPGFVFGTKVSLFLLFNCYAIVQCKQYQAKGKWTNNLYGERRYLVLRLVAKTAQC